MRSLIPDLSPFALPVSKLRGLADARCPSSEVPLTTSTWPLNSSTTPSSLRNRFNNSASLSLAPRAASPFLGRRGARPGAGKSQCMCAFVQLEHGDNLSHRTFLRLQVTHDLGFNAGAEELLLEVWRLFGGGEVTEDWLELFGSKFIVVLAHRLSIDARVFRERICLLSTGDYYTIAMESTKCGCGW